MDWKIPITIALSLTFLTACVPASARKPAPPSSISTNLLVNNPALSNSLKEFREIEGRRSKLLKSLGFQEGEMCVTPMAVSTNDIDINRSLFVHDQATLTSANFSLRRTLSKLASDVSGSVPTTTAETIFQQFWDTQNDVAGAQTPLSNPHCSDSDGKINGIPLNTCPRAEGTEAGGSTSAIAAKIDGYIPLALVNRIDLAHEGWKNCGEHRIIYAKDAGAGGIPENLIIFEAVLPNPKPGCRSGCRDVVEFWLDLSTDPAPASRAAKLENFFYNGIVGATGTDFREVVHSSHYSASGVSSVYGGSGSGQIRTNQFLQPPLVGGGLEPWTLKEFKTFLSCAGGNCDYDIMPIAVKGSPFGHLWNKDVATGAVIPPLPANNSAATPVPGLAALADNFQADVLLQITTDKLANPDINSFSYAVDPNKNAAESQSLSPTVDHYRTQFNAAGNASFRSDMNTAATPFGLTNEQVVNRAISLSCAGCHMPSAFGLLSANAIGPGMSWPDALSFVHVDPDITSIAGHPEFDLVNFGGNSQGFQLSPALNTTFLPARENNFAGLANQDVCDCERKVLDISTFEARRPSKFKLIQRDRLLAGREIEKLRRQFNQGTPAPSPSAVRKLQIAERKVIANFEQRRNEFLTADGVEFVASSKKPVPTHLADQDLPEAEFNQIKVKTFNEIVEKTPPRKTVNGSFRSH